TMSPKGERLLQQADELLKQKSQHDGLIRAHSQDLWETSSAYNFNSKFRKNDDSSLYDEYWYERFYHSPYYWRKSNFQRYLHNFDFRYYYRRYLNVDPFDEETWNKPVSSFTSNYYNSKLRDAYRWHHFLK
uniref:Uncharacterized protein n=1 Tax=Acrobeloides nanus TaxID=290746 RepID=A0A914DU30_9BILA